MFQMLRCHTRSSHLLNSYLSVAPKLFFPQQVSDLALPTFFVKSPQGSHTCAHHDNMTPPTPATQRRKQKSTLWWTQRQRLSFLPFCSWCLMGNISTQPATAARNGTWHRLLTKYVSSWTCWWQWGAVHTRHESELFAVETLHKDRGIKNWSGVESVPRHTLEHL